MIGGDPRKPTPAQVLADMIVRDRRLRPPVDVEALVAELAEIREMPFETGTGLDAILFGLSDTDLRADQPVLLLNNNVAPTRRRFTLAHEFGHLSMAWHYETMSCNVDLPLDEDAESDVWAAGASSYELERDADEFASRILVPKTFVDGLDHADPEKMLTALEAADVSAEAGVIGLATQLPPGYVFVLINPFGNIHRVVYSRNTFNLGLRRDERLHTDHLASYMSNSGQVVHRGSRIYWGIVSDSMDLAAEDDNWEDRLLKILQQADPDATRGDKQWASACAIASAANSNFGHDNVAELAVRIKQRFLRRPDFRDLVDDEDFDAFASARARAFATRPPKRRRK